jgi:hypothetical protein
MTIDERAYARRGDPSTSWEAAASVTGIRESQREILAILRQTPDGMTDEALIAEHVSRVRGHGALAGKPMSVSGVRSRRAELVDMGLVRDSGRRSTTVAGRKTIIWEATPGDEAALGPTAEPVVAAAPQPGTCPKVIGVNPALVYCGVVLSDVKPTLSPAWSTGHCSQHGTVMVRR